MTRGNPSPPAALRASAVPGLQLFSKPLRHLSLASLALRGAISECRFSPCLWIIARRQSHALKATSGGENPRRSCCHCYRSAYLQAGAPSEVAIPAGSAPSFTKMEHVTAEPPTRLLFVIVASHPPPGVLIPTRLLPVVGHQLT